MLNMDVYKFTIKRKFLTWCVIIDHIGELNVGDNLAILYLVCLRIVRRDMCYLFYFFLSFVCGYKGVVTSIKSRGDIFKSKEGICFLA